MSPANDDLSDDRQPKAPTARLKPVHWFQMARAAVLWPLLALLVFSMLHGWVFVLADGLGPTLPDLIDLEIWWTRHFDPGIELITVVAPLGAWCLRSFGARDLLPNRVERLLVDVLAWGLLVYPSAVLVDAVIEVVA